MNFFCLMKKKLHGEVVKIRKFSNVFEELNINKIDLLKVNIEGSEYNLMPHIIEEKLIERINNTRIICINLLTMYFDMLHLKHL